MRETIKHLPYLGEIFIAIYEFLFEKVHRIQRGNIRKQCIISHRWKKIRKELNRTFADSEDPEIQELLQNIKTQGDIRLFNYPFADRYSDEILDVQEGAQGYKYVYYPCPGGGRRKIYFPLEWTEEQIRKAGSQLLLEQDTDSPHCYRMDHYEVPDGAVVLDCGTAEGNFSINIVDKAKHIYLFEGDEKWHIPLEMTFEPWHHKVTIVPKYISDIDNDDYISLDTFISDQELYQENLYIKMDIEGYEEKALQGLRRSIHNIKHLRMAICTYHSQRSKDDIMRFFEEDGRFEMKLSKGYMILNFFSDKPQFPYIRKGVLFVKTGD